MDDRNKELTPPPEHAAAPPPEFTLPPELLVAAETEDGEVMAVTHRDFPVCGLQFHPESILTPNGREIVANFLNMAEAKSGL